MNLDQKRAGDENLICICLPICGLHVHVHNALFYQQGGDKRLVDVVVDNTDKLYLFRIEHFVIKVLHTK